MNYLVVALVVSLGVILCGLLVVQQLSVFIQGAWQRRLDFDPTTVLAAARFAGTMMLGAGLVVAALVFHWRFAHHRLDWDWGLILGHVDSATGDLVEDLGESRTEPPLDPCLEGCMAFCRENDD